MFIPSLRPQRRLHSMYRQHRIDVVSSKLLTRGVALPPCPGNPHIQQPHILRMLPQSRWHSTTQRRYDALSNQQSDNAAMSIGTVGDGAAIYNGGK